MQHIIDILTLHFRPSLATGVGVAASEPLDHPCLTGADHAFIDDLPLPAFAIEADGSVQVIEAA
ncbi:MAG: hypothetical protein WAT35_09315 [Tabrizicola sp.]|jgi:hypothetical protein|uniref:hypothetical protein n=1 Tax=Tabrizicola sp. TaxID=2005166 RepID=UPI003BB0F33A|nr:hypothetical protein [Tabrizicola sp.]